MNLQPSVGVLLAVHRPNKDFFLQQIQSLKDQTYKNWKCIISDDSSDVNVKTLMDEVVTGDPRFKYVQLKNKPGVIKNFENAYLNRLEDADYYCFCDQDDIWLPNKIEVLLDVFFRHFEVSLVHSDGILIDHESAVLAESLWGIEGRDVGRSTTRDILLKNNITGCTTMFRKSVMELAIPFPEELIKTNILHDQWVGICASTIDGGIFPVDKKLVCYRQHSGNVVGYAEIMKVNKRIYKESKIISERVKRSAKLQGLLNVMMDRSNCEQINKLKKVNFASGVVYYLFKGDFTRAIKSFFAAANWWNGF